MSKSRILSWFAVLGLMCMIFFLSAQPAEESSRTSNSVSEVVAAIVYNNPTPVLLDQVDSYVREYAHFLIFTLLSLFTYVGFVNAVKKPAVLALAACTLYALTDEFHQLFVAGRSFQLLDLALDFFGSVLGIGACLLFNRLRWKERKSRKKNRYPSLFN